MKVAIAVLVSIMVLAAGAALLARTGHVTRMRRAALALCLLGQVLAVLYYFCLAIFYDLGDVMLGVGVAMGFLCLPADYALYRVLTVAEQQLEAKERARMLEEQGRALAKQQRRLDTEEKKAQAVRAELAAELEGILASFDEQVRKNDAPDFSRIFQIMSSSSGRVCQHHVVGALLASKQEEAQSKGIRVEFDLGVPDDLPFSDTELCAVFSNLFDNASNACEQLEEGKDRFIDMRAYLRSSFFIIEMTNSCAKIQRKRKKRKASGVFSEHGWGLSIIKTIAERHGGFLETEQKGDRFHTMVAMELGA